MLEHLESRRLLAAQLVGTVLTITGTAGDDVIEFARRGGGFKVFERIGNSVSESSWDYSAISRVIVNAGNGNDRVIVGRLAVHVELNGGAGNDTLSAGGGNDTIRGGDGNDDMFGGDGRDLLIGGAGADTMLGGGSRDVVDYSDRTANLVITLGITADDGEAGENDLVATDIEVVVGGSGDDHISTASGRSVSLYGAAGNDTLIGGSGPDLLEGGPGRDFMSGQAGNDVFQAQDGEIDTIDGGSGSDTGVFDDGDLFTSVP
ncbi:MAG TPA: calcium-binding protein [Tepidisphaeraceae bacterium]|nr:calcium-binding protein [Tepidisphaeraceae bacterium]